MTPLLWPLWWAATRSSASSTATFRPRPASAMAVPRPTRPAPAMAISQTLQEPSSEVMRWWGGSRGQPLDRPIFRVSLVAQTVVQPAGSPLPEFDALGADSVTAPVVRQGNVAVREALGRRRHPLFELLAAGEGPALGRGPGPQARAPGAGDEIGCRLLPRDPLDRPLDPHLPFQGRPVEHQGRPGVLQQLLSLAALI